MARVRMTPGPRVMTKDELRRTQVALARESAIRLAVEHGTVTSPDVVADLKTRGQWFTGLDPRLMGAVFRRGWNRTGFVRGGSHGRPVALWELKEEL